MAITGFMKPVVYQGGYFEIDTTQGIQIVPDDVLGWTTPTVAKEFDNYIEGEPLDPDEVIEHKTGWLARLSAPGYMDCTDWTAHATLEEAEQYLEDTYGDDAE
jgi:hypothetical protein